MNLMIFEELATQKATGFYVYPFFESGEGDIALLALGGCGGLAAVVVARHLSWSSCVDVDLEPAAVRLGLHNTRAHRITLIWNSRR